MFFKKKKRKDEMIDLTKIRSTNKEIIPKPPRAGSSEGILNFFEPGKLTKSSEESYTKREVDQKIVELDNKIYKLEQRIELLEKKFGIKNSSDNIGPAGW